MHTQTVFELSQEAERLLQLSLHNLHSLKTMPVATLDDALNTDIKNASNVHPLHFSARGIDAQQATLSNELRKITRLEMVLAIVGTMKAGKSTTINAIVGTEVLPNRNRPMTALPTLIRHTPGQKEPVLHFSHVGPIDTLTQQLQMRLFGVDREKLAQKLEIDKDMQTLLDRIRQGDAFDKHYLGAQPIFHCLKSLNDLVRLSKALDVDFPFSSYTALEHIPVIEVEFVHLAGLEKNMGQLTLLDTPGPNEAGQPHLQQMLKEQLARASAVLAVMATPEQPWTLESMAARAFLSRATFARHFARVYHLTPQAWLSQLRMALAARLLRLERQTNLEVIAERCGFQSLASFSKRFKMRYGVTPGEWRRG